MEQERIDMAYIAGVFDGDGSFSLIKRKNGDRSPLYQAMLQLANANKDLIDFIKDKFGGWIFERKSYIGKDGSNRKISYEWKVEKKSVSSVITRLIEFLVVKKDRANYLLRYIQENPFVRGSVRLSDEILERREKAYLEMVRLNDERTWTKTIESSKRRHCIDSTFWSYFAGLMDTDGSFSIKKELRKSSKSAVYSPCIQLTMIDPKGINFIRQRCVVGNISTVKSRSAKAGICYRYAIHTRLDAVPFLESIIPYLKTKKSQAELLLAYCKEYVSTDHRRGGLCEDELSRRDLAYQHMIHLNKYGVFKPSLIDLEAQRMGDRAEGESHRERLSERAS